MSETFEELLTREIDALWEAALFLNGGEALAAEECLLAGMREGFRDFRGGERGDDFGRWMEGRLVRTYVERSGPSWREIDGRGEGGGTPEDRTVELTRARLNEIAGDLPPGPRAAIWLVLVRRWSYEEAGGVIGVDRDELVDLLRRGRSLVPRLLSPERDSRRSEGGSHV